MRSPSSAAWRAAFAGVFGAALLLNPDAPAQAQKQHKGGAAVTFPPALPDGKQIVTEKSAEFLKPPATLRKDVAVAKTPPAVDFLYYPGQAYEGRPWSNWGDSLAAGGKYYASIGDHLAIGAKGDGG